MKLIKIEKWGTFNIGELFDIHPTKAYKLTNSSLMEEDGVNPIVVNSSFNNGIGGYTNQENTEKGGIITFSDTTSADAIFFQETDFVGYPHVQGMYPIGKYKDKWSKYSLLFFVSVFRNRALGLNYDYVNKFTRESAKQISIKLPVDETGNPDFLYMESYMKNLELAVSSSLTDLQSAKKFNIYQKIDVTQWKEFVIKDLFTVKRPLARSQANYDDGDVPFVASGNFNNGVLKYLEPKKGEILDVGNCITVSPIDGSSFYQENDFLGRGGAGSSIILLYNPNLNLYNGYFIATVIRTVCRKYAYSDMANKDTIGAEKIKLPVTSDGTPDYDYMTEFISKIKYQSVIALKNLQTLDNVLGCP